MSDASGNSMTALDALIPTPRLLEQDEIQLSLPIERAWEAVRHGNLASSRIVRALFAIRTLPSRTLGAAPEPVRLRFDELISSPENPGFQLLAEEKPHVVAVGAIGKVWRPDIEFVHVPDAQAFNAFAEHDYVKVAWALELSQLGERDTRVVLELRVDATDERAWHKFQSYFRVIGPASRFIRRSALVGLGREHGTPEGKENARRMHLRWLRFVHNFMERAQLRHLKARVGGSLPRDDLHDITEGLSGAALMVLNLLTPFLRQRRQHWGLSVEEAARAYPGDELLPEPDWDWTHAVEVAARAEEVWPWLSQVGSNKGGFYSYQWLENVAGCNLRNAETVHPEWEVHTGEELRLHPNMPGLLVTDVEPGHHFVAYAAPDPHGKAQGRSWVAASWLFFVEPLGPTRCRVISRYRAAYSDDLATRLSFGSTLLEPVGFAMDRRMLLGIKERAEQTNASMAVSSSLGGHHDILLPSSRSERE